MAGGGDNLKDRRTARRPQRVEPPASRQRQPQLQTDQGLASLIPELTYTLQDVKDAIDTIAWHGGNMQHSLTADGGYTTSLELESKLPEDLVDALYEEVPGDYSGVIAYYRDKKTGKEASVTAGDQEKPKRLRHLYASKANAKRAVEKEWKKIQAGLPSS